MSKIIRLKWSGGEGWDDWIPLSEFSNEGTHWTSHPIARRGRKAVTAWCTVTVAGAKAQIDYSAPPFGELNAGHLERGVLTIKFEDASRTALDCAEWESSDDPDNNGPAQDFSIDEGDSNVATWRRGLPPKQGVFEAEYTDGQTSVYLMVINNPLPFYSDRQGGQIVKIGMAQNTAIRLKQLNSGFPPQSALQWTKHMELTFPDAKTAYIVEGKLLDWAGAKNFVVGGEFGYIPDSQMAELIDQYEHLRRFIAV